MTLPTRPGLFPAAARRVPPVGKAVVAAFRFTPLPAPRRSVVTALADGRTMAGRMDDHTQRKVLYGVYEAQETALVRERLRPGDTFVDVGANIGWFTTLAAGIVGPAGHVHAYEPFPSNAAHLRRNVAANTPGNVTLHEAVVSDAPGTVQVGRPDASDSGAVTAGPWGTAETAAVPAVTLDDTVPADREVALMKVDVEGFEEHVLGGASATLARTRALVIELNRPALEVNGSSPEAIVALVHGAGLTEQRLIDVPSGDPRQPPEFSNLLAERP